MSFPASPIDGQTATVNGVLYTYTAAAGSWTRFTSGAGTPPVVYSGNVSYSNLSVTGNLTYANLVSNGVSRSAIAYTATAGTPPASPLVGDQWYDTNTDSLYTYFTDGTSTFWLDISDRPNFVKFTTSSTAPANPNVGDQWYDSSTDSLFTRISDGTSSYWVDLLSNKDSLLYTAGTSPNTNRPGDQWYDTATDTLYTRVTDGTSSYWVDYSSARQGIVNGNSNISIAPNANISFYSGGNNTLTINSNGITVSGNANTGNLSVTGTITATQSINAPSLNVTTISTANFVPTVFAPGTLTTTLITETVNLQSTATSTQNIDLQSGTVWFFASNQSVSTTTINFRGGATTTLNSLLLVGQSVTCAILLKNGATADYINAVQVDGAAFTPLWQGGIAPAAGNTSSTDVYNFTIIKTGNAAFTVLGTQSKFA